MNKILVLTILCLTSTNCLDLENICSSHIFNYNDVQVNSFHRVQSNLTFDSLSSYLINDSITCDIAEFKERQNFFDTLKIKHEFNRKLAELYTEELNGLTAEKLLDKVNELAHASLIPLKFVMHKEEEAKCLKAFETAVWRGYGVLLTLHHFAKDNKQPTLDFVGYDPPTHQLIANLKELMKKFKKPTDNRTFALQSDTHWSVYFDRAIALPRQFEFLSTEPNQLRETMRSILSFDLFLPFNNKLYQNEPCVAIEDLPLFYKKKGQENRIDYRKSTNYTTSLQSFKQKAHLNRHRESHSKASSNMWTTKTSDRRANDKVDDYSGGSIDYKMGTARSERDLHRRTDGRLSTHQRVAETSDSEERRVITNSGLAIVYGVEYRPTDSHDENDS